ncbi:MAG: hypothetical protein C4526_03260 [Nitrospiraceae bacterium]|nr:MAG: hypothetical protein C4526_03260 [Nitrospiraceae bacterium]
MESEFLKSLVIIFGASAMVVFLFNRMKIPSVVGFLVAGVIIGPYGIGIVKDTHSVEMLAEVGVILLLFTIGIEFSIAKLTKMRKAVLVGGGLQVLLTITLAAAASFYVTRDINKSVFIGFLIALSSTAIVLKLLAEKGETDSPHGRMMLGILIFQDICVVPLMLLTPALSGEGINIMSVLVKIGNAALIIAVVLVSASWFVPGLLHQIVRTRSRELFITTIILLCFGIALLTSKFGLSLALGAFLAGLIISESEYAHQAMSDLLPFKDSFIGLFFVSVGMLMDTGYISGNFPLIVTAVILIFGIKIFTGTLSPLLIGAPLRASIYTGIGLSQIGEFSFVLVIAGKAAGIVTGDFYQVFLSSSILTMIVTPFIVKAAPLISGWMVSRQVMQRIDRIRKVTEPEGRPGKRQKHVIIIGFGLNGRNLAKVLKEARISYAVLEMNSDTVRKMKKKGEPIYYGDGTSKEILHKMNIRTARMLVIAISDPASARMIVSIARHENPDIYIIVRTRYLAEVEDLIALGANEVIPEEFETSVEIFSRVLHYYNVPRNVVADYTQSIRKNSYNVLRTVGLPRIPLAERYEFLKDMDTDTYLIKGSSGVNGHTIKDLNLRAETGVTIMAVQRGDRIHQNPSPDLALQSGDVLLLVGRGKDINKAVEYLGSDKFIAAKYH